MLSASNRDYISLMEREIFHETLKFFLEITNMFSLQRV